ncbi:MAG: PKD domain-containing protein [Bacteroidota bacterium]
MLYDACTLFTNRLPMRFFLLLFMYILGTAWGGMTHLSAQVGSSVARPASVFGGSSARTLDLKRPENGSVYRIPVYDFIKFNPRYRSLLPIKRKCSTLEMEEERKTKHGGESDQQFETWLQRNTQTSRSLMRKAIEEVYTLPVVVHVIYSNETENISEEQVMSQIEVLNQDYRRMNPDSQFTPAAFRAVAADTRIQFCMASVDPQGQPTDGIERISISGAPFRDSYINEVIKPNTIWDPDRYFNIWVCNIAGGILGYAQFPTSSGLVGIPVDNGARQTDGVVIHFNAFGTTGTAVPPFNRGRTGTHEIGHWLGLRHIWGDGPCNVDDFCFDTPPASDPHFSCPASSFACQGVAMTQNYMDYTDDACMNMFTKDQKKRMRLVLENSPRRRSLITSGVCTPLALAPVAKFEADLPFGAGPITVNFRDLSLHEPVSWEWTFPGGNPSRSTDPNPQVSYMFPGTYPVSLQVRNQFGESRQLTKHSFVTVYNKGLGLPLQASFEQLVMPPDSFFLVNKLRNKTWQHSGRVGARGESTGSLWFNNYEHHVKHDMDILVSPVIDLSEAAQTVLSFDVAYAYFGERYTDTLGVFISTNGSSEFEAIYYRGGKQLSTTEPYNRPFTPYPEEWRTEAIDLSAYDGKSKVQIAVVNFSGYGNNLYLDNFRLAGKPMPRPEADFAAGLQSICVGDTLSFEEKAVNAGNASFMWSFPGGIPSTDTSRFPTVTYPKPGVYAVSLTVTNEAGSSTLSEEAFVTVKKGPSLSTNLIRDQICKGSTRTLSATGAQTYTWSPAEGLNQTSGPTVKAAPELNTTYQVKGFGANGCASVATITLELGEGQNFEVSPAVASVCPGQEVLLTASGATRFEWIPSNGISNPNEPLVRVRPAQTTTYKVTGYQQNGCGFTKEVTVKVEDEPKIYARAEKEQVCPGEGVRLVAVGGSGAYRWSASDGGIVDQGSPVTVFPVQTTTYRVNSGNIGCNVQAEVKITVLPKPEVTPVKAEVIVCKGQAVAISARGATTFEWLPAPGLTYDKGASVNVTPTISTTYKAVGKDASGCRDTAAVEVMVQRPPKISLTASRPAVCRGMSTQLTANGATSYSWRPTFGLSSSVGSIVTASPSQTTVYEVTATDDYGCTATKKQEVQVVDNQAPVAAFDIAQRTNCLNTPVQLIDRSQFASSYRWEFPGGTPASSNEQAPTVTYAKPGVYSVKLQVVGCGGTDEEFRESFIFIEEGTSITVPVEKLTLCKGETTLLRANGAAAYAWEPSTGLDRTEGKLVVASPEKSTQYTVTGRDVNGCVSSAKIMVEVGGGSDKLTVSAPKKAICKGESLALQVSGAESYLWTSQNGGSLGEGALLTVSPQVKTTYLVEGKDFWGCRSSGSLTIDVREAPELTVEAIPATICKGERVTLMANGGLQYEWAPHNSLTETSGGKVTAQPTQSTTYQVTATNGIGCEKQASLTVEVTSGKELKLVAEKSTLCPGDSALLQVSGGDSYRWSPGYSLSARKGERVMARPRFTTTYTVRSFEGGNCPGIATITLEVAEPEALTLSSEKTTICPGDTLALGASGGSRYQWFGRAGLIAADEANAKVSPLTTTTYKVKGYSPEGCPVEGALTVQVRKPLEASLAASTATVCEGEEVALSLREADGWKNFEWLGTGMRGEPLQGKSPTARISRNTTFKVVGTDEFGCRDTASINVQVSRLSGKISASTQDIDLANQAGFVRFEDLTQGATRWKWDFGDGGSSTQKSPTHVFTEPGEFEVRLQVSNEVCTQVVSQNIVVENSSSIDELLDESGLRVYPQPTQGPLTMEFQSPREMFLKFRLIDSSGRSVVSDAVMVEKGLFKRILNLSNFPAGTYTLQITDGEEVFNKTVNLLPISMPEEEANE